MIKDAIADSYVLRFSVEYQRTIFARQVAQKGIDPEKIDDPAYCKRHNIDIDDLYHDDERIRKVAEHILDHHERHIHPQGADTYTALFAVDSIKSLGQYYDVLKELNGKRPEDKRYKIAAIFSYGANEDMDGVGDEHSVELLERIIKDYNEVFGTSFSTEGFDAYRKDIAKRLKQKTLPQVDILIVVNMMLTGFDAKPLNTLYLDKNLVWHTLVQAYSRTNRVDKLTKQFGQIITYRNIKQWQDDALRLFSGDGDPNEYLLENYEYYLQKWINQAEVLRKVVKTVDEAGHLKNEDEIRIFIIAFRSLIGTLATLKTFSKFDWDDLAVVMNEEEFDGFKSWYLYFWDWLKGERNDGNPDDDTPNVPVDIDFEIELVRTDRINVVYILNLLKSVNKAGRTVEEREADLDLIMREIERSDNESLRAKKEIIKEFIRTRFYELSNDADIQAAFEDFVKEKQKAEMEEFAYENNVDFSVVSDIMTEYAFNGQISEESIRKRYDEYHLGIRRTTDLTEKTQKFIKDSYFKYRAEGE
ncbi:MAG: type I restriction endonuclease subunit R [Methanomicrobium sp.]|nr:type I restriction endonuclease subunit R [Methanomicrobium sp.]